MNKQVKNPFFTNEENEMSNQYIDKGYLIAPVADKDALSWIRQSFFDIVKKELKIKKNKKEEDLLNLIHKKISPNKLNDFRLHVIRKINNLPDLRVNYFKLAKPYLDIIVGNELVMQARINLSIQLPNDDSSLLATHADTWSGDSPFEVVVWIPLVDCYSTKSMYILPPIKSKRLDLSFQKMAGQNSDNLFNAIEKDVEWIKINYGEMLLFNMALPHGNRVNLEHETRWTMNCRFKAVFSPYSEKKIGSFFEPITLKAASIDGMKYKLPELI